MPQTPAFSLRKVIVVGLGLTSVLLWSCQSSSRLAAQSPGGKASQTITRLTDVRVLPGKLDAIPMVNSNSPEWPKQEGILLSTFPATGKAFPVAHLGYPISGAFELFDHHYMLNPPAGKTLYLGILVHNPAKQPSQLRIEAAASNLVLALPKQPPTEDGDGTRASDATLKGLRQARFPAQLTIPAGGYQMLLNQPIDLEGLKRPLNGRSTHIRLNSLDQRGRTPALIYVASLAQYGKMLPNGQTRPPTLPEWQSLLKSGNLAKPRDKTPTAPQATGGALIYGRVAGVQEGVKWQADLVDPGQKQLLIPESGKAISFVVATLRGGTLGTQQTQSAKMLARYADTAYEAHGNYCVHYDLTAPLFNATSTTQTVTVALETPLKIENKTALTFQTPPQSSAVFAGLVRVRYRNDQGERIESYIKVKQLRGQVVEPLLKVSLKPQERRSVQVDFLYPPDSTPPQVLTFSTQPAL